jgi:hypothetical protein
MSKNKGKNKGGEGSTEAAASAPKALRKAMPPRPPLPERLCNKADKIYEMVTGMGKELAARGAPMAIRDATSAFVVRVEAWRESFFTLKSSGWVPLEKSAKVVIVEGDPIKIVDEHLARYSFIEGLADGRVQLVAGSVVQVNRFQVDVMLKDTEGKFYGYAPRKFLVRR